MSSEPCQTIVAVDRAFEILDYVRREGPVGVSTAAAAFDISPSGMHKQLATMEHRGWLSREDSKYALSPKAILFGERARNRNPVYAAGWQAVEDLIEEPWLIAHLTVECDGSMVSLRQVFGEESVGREFFMKNQSQDRDELHCSSAAKAILAHLPSERVDEILADAELEAYTNQTITSREELVATFETIREEGVAFNDEEGMNGLRAVSAPILDAEDGTVHGAIGLGGLANKIDDDLFYETLADRAKEAASIVRINLQMGNYVHID
jgi:DNA-binding IclR family transcriptional regulator